jgi:glycosyltransferase involved in cell wall biosynthesis
VKVLLSIHHALDPDLGAPGITLALGNAYQELGHEVGFLSFDDLPDKLPGLAKEALYPWFAAPRLRRAAAEGVDVIDASTGDAWLWALARRAHERSPLLVTRSHGLEHRYWAQAVEESVRRGARMPLRSRLYHGGVRLREVARSLRTADYVIFGNDDDRDYAVERLGLAGQRARVFPNGLPQSFLGLPLEPADSLERIAYVGSWAERKGKSYLAAALSETLERDVRLRATLLGTQVSADTVLGDFPPGVRDRLLAVPHYDHGELPSLVRGHQVAISASLAEGFSLAVPEVMACGLAPVVTNIPSAAAVVRHEDNGLLVPTRDALAITQAIERLSNDRELLWRLRAGAHSTAQTLSWRRVAEQTLALYEHGLATR